MNRSLTVLFCLAAVSIPAYAARRVSVKQLEQAIAELHNKSDREAEHQLATFELAERITPSRLARATADLPGDESRQRLTALADSSSFLNLPADEIPASAPPSREAQQQILSLASAYIEKTLSHLPNFFASEAITLFEDTPAYRDGASFTAYRPIHFQSRRNAKVLYRGGKEIMETGAGEVVENDQLVSSDSGLLSSGEFGPVLSTVLTDAHKGHLAWSHWESAPTAPMAVFRYTVPRKESHYRVKVDLADQSKPFQARPGYHGEIGIDSATGTILRLTLRADMLEDDPLGTADLMVEYGSVVIGGVAYICPVRSVATVVTGRYALGASGGLDNSLGLHTNALYPVNSRDFPTQTIMNNVEFEHYHLLRSDARILTGADTEDTPGQP